jgi:hypothetical protein
MKLIFKIFKKIRKAQNRDKHRTEMYKLGVSITMKKMQEELESYKKKLNEKDEELRKKRTILSEYLHLDINKLIKIEKKVKDIAEFMSDNRDHIAYHPRVKMNLGPFDKDYCDPNENRLVNNKLRKIDHKIKYENGYADPDKFFIVFVDLYWHLESAYREIVRYETKIDAINAQQVAINDQILKLGIVNGVNK